MTEPGSFTDEQLTNFSNGPLNLLQNDTTSKKVLDTITSITNTRTLFKLNLSKEELVLFNLDRKQIKDEIEGGATLSEDAIQRLKNYDLDMYALYTRMHPRGGRRTKCRRNKKRSRSHSRRHKKRSSTKRRSRS
jgi:hypothetical protein